MGDEDLAADVGFAGLPCGEGSWGIEREVALEVFEVLCGEVLSGEGDGNVEEQKREGEEESEGLHEGGGVGVRVRGGGGQRGVYATTRGVFLCLQGMGD